MPLTTPDPAADTRVMASPTFARPTAPHPSADPLAPVHLDRACGFCAADNSRYLYSTTTIEGDRFSFRNCLVCRAVFLAPRPSPERLADAYSMDYYGAAERKFIAPIERTIDFFRSSRARRVSRHLPRAGRVLDIGCGNGGFLKDLADRGFEAYGIERPGGSADRARRVANIDVRVGTLEDGFFDGERFDAITLWHVFEHLAEPRKTLQLLTDLLEPGGRLYLSLPNVDSLQCQLFKGDWLHHDPPRHLFYLDSATLTREVESLGFERRALSFHSLEQNPFGIVQSLLNRWSKERDVLFESLKGNTELAARHRRSSLLTQKALFIVGYPLFALLATLESLAGRGGTMELVFEKISSVALDLDEPEKTS